MKILLGSGVQMDLDKAIESRILVQANSGGGKSYTIRRFIEQAFGKKQIIVLDPEGEFANMRSKFDFVYAGPGGDAPVESRSAALLARRLLELKASAIIDLYELPPQERKHFVRLFLESMVNAPKELWHDCFVVLDEAHIFAPEKEQSESLTAVIDMASRGRKRGYCLIPATQRPAKLNKDVAAECNNKLIGRASLDIDRKRAAEELGFTTREEILSLRDLEPGEFYCFGPAIGREVVRTIIGQVEVTPPKRGVARGHVPAPSAKVKAILSQLVDLPQEAKKEAQTIAELKAELAIEKRKKAPVAPPSAPTGISKQDLAKAVKDAEHAKDAQYFAERDEWIKHMNTLFGIITSLGTAFADFKKTVGRKKPLPPPPMFSTAVVKPTRDDKPIQLIKHPDMTTGELSKGPEAILNAIAQYPGGITTEHIAILTGYKTTSRVTYLNELLRLGYITKDGSVYHASQEGITALGDRLEHLPTGRALLDHWLAKLPEGEKRVLQAIVDGAETKPAIEEVSGYKTTSVVTYVNKLVARKIVVNEGGLVKIAQHLYE